MEVRTNTDIADVVDHIHDRVQLGSLEISWRSAAVQAASGQRRGNRKGPGFEHHGFKEYDPADGDNAAHIDPSASAAESEDDVYIVRIFKRPRLTSLNIAIDVGESMNLGSIQGGFKSYLAAVALGCGVKAAEKSGDRLSLVTYAEQPQSIFKLRDPGSTFYQAIHAAIEDRRLPAELNGGAYGLTGLRQALKNLPQSLGASLRSLRRGFSSLNPSNLKARFSAAVGLSGNVSLGPDVTASTSTAGGGLNLALEALHRDIRSVFMVVTDCVNLNDADWDALQACATNHDTIVVFVQDRRERELPAVPWPGMYFRLVDYLGRRVSFWIAPDWSPGWYLGVLKRLFGSVTTRETFKRNFARWEENILARLEQCGITAVVLRNDDEEEAIHQLLRVLAGDRLDNAVL